MKETDETWRLLQEHITTKEDISDALYANGVKRRCIKHRDPFHIHQLIIKHLSEASFGKTTKGDHEQNHHRQVMVIARTSFVTIELTLFSFDLKMMQVIWDIYDRDRDVFMSIAREILGDIKDWLPKPLKEKDTRWLTNGRSGASILVGYHIVDENGTCFWILLARRLRYIYSKRSDWKIERLDLFIKWMMMPEMIAGLWLEAEAVEYFESHYAFHAMPGELCERPGFRALELFFEIVDHAFPWWQKALEDPKSRFPNLYAHLETMDDEAKDVKQHQIMHGIEEAYDELAKLYNDFFAPPWIFTGFTYPDRGAIILRVVLDTMSTQGFDLDGVYDDQVGLTLLSCLLFIALTLC